MLRGVDATNAQELRMTSPYVGRIIRTAVAVLVLLTSSYFVDLAAAQSAPDTWQAAVIGDSTSRSGATKCSGVACITAVMSAAVDTSATIDQVTFVNGALTGDGTLVTRVDSFDRLEDGVRAGLMVRDSLSAGSRQVFAYVSPMAVAGFQWRDVTGAARSTTAGTSGSLPMWLKVRRTGNQFTTYRSTNGTDWLQVAQQTVTMGSTVRVGLAVASEGKRRSTARFSLTSLTATLPTDWDAIDIGSNAGGATYPANSKLTVASAGRGILGTADDFHFVFRAVTTDVDVIARVGGIKTTDTAAATGLMVRRSMHPAAANAAVLVTPAGSVSFERRLLANASAIVSAGGTATAPVWLKLQRRGNQIAVFRSSDAIQWTPVGEDTISFGDQIYVGVVLANHDPTTMASANVDSIDVHASNPNVSPTVSVSSPISGTTVAAGTSVVISAAAGDSDGSVAAVDFLVNGSVIATDVSAPFGATWTPSAGTYVLQAVAHDDQGATTTSSSVTITVQAPALPPPLPAPGLLTFTPSPDDVTGVAFYQLEIFRADTELGSAVIVTSLGKPPVVNGQISVDLSTTLAQLASGTYVAVVDAIGAGGVSSSAPSPSFIR
jgi:regulation of enolase protein 1 (concanavalin A-like superfamily)